MNSRIGKFPPSSLLLFVVTGALSTPALSGCASSVKTAEISASANTVDEAASLEADIQEGYKAQLDVLAPRDFAKAQAGLETVKSQIKDSAKQEKLVHSLAIARGYLNQAKDIANGRRSSVQGVLDARTLALNANVRNYPKENVKMKDLDDDFRAQAGRSTIQPAEFADLQKRYLNLELASIQNKNLGKARAAIAQARDNSATKNTPKTLNRAETALTSAENQIAANRNNAHDFQASVQQANAAAVLLSAVLASTKRPDGTVASEEVALNLVAQNHTIHGLDNQLVDAADDATAKENVIAHQAVALDSQGKQLATANVAISIDQALERGRQQFSNDEAEVYRQGTKLLIRLKAIQFTSGKSDLPPESLQLLAKVRTVAEALNPSQVEVQGHTDSIGSAETNQSLSQSRAQAVATYLGSNGIDREKVEAVGFGYKKPLATNKTKEGRAQNRRVDILITPTTI